MILDNCVLLGLDAPGWRCVEDGPTTVWVKGYLFGVDDSALPARVQQAVKRDAVGTFLASLDGHFVMVARSADCVFGAVDHVRSVPLFLVDSDAARAISPAPMHLVERYLSGAVDPDGALAMAMAGYTVGAGTLYAGLQQLRPGEFFEMRRDAPTVRKRYHRYEPWRPDTAADEAALKAELAHTTMVMMEKMQRSAGGRRFFVPLSAGRDSRLIVSLLAELGAKNVVCFAYGLRDNFEAQASRKIAEYLGYEWHFAAFRPASQKRFWNSEVMQRYRDFADSACSTTIAHDLPAIVDLMDRGILEQDAIVVNGNSGDYISGLHIQAPVLSIGSRGDDSSYFEKVTDILIDKHFRLWGSLANAENDAVIRRQLISEMVRLNVPNIGPGNIHGLYEYAEFQDRQAKSVISRQRIYEFMGLEWRLPLWSRDYLDFWYKVPVEAKAYQKLYRDMLLDENWGGVWQGDQWVFPPRVSPAWMRWIVRPLCKAACAPLGKAAWHRFERHYLSYWTDLFAWQAIHPYRHIAADNRGARHLISWHTEAFLHSKGLRYDGRPIG